MMDDIVRVRRGGSPLILSMPHSGTEIPPEVAKRLNETGLSVPDTDWWIPRLYDFADGLDATVVEARLSRYVIDVNRDPSGASLYPGRATTELCPTTTFDGEPIYQDAMAPGVLETGIRRDRYFWPYHIALRSEIDRVHEAHGYALLYDCHSIRSVVPRLFAGTLPVFNIGTNDGQSCAPEIEAAISDAVAEACAEACAAASDGPAHQPPRDEGSESDLTYIVNGRFKGGWITRHFGEPDSRVHAVQMELAQTAYMLEAAPWTFNEDGAARMRPVLRRVLDALIEAGARIAGARIEGENR
ncbi:N-formylglutamate amidohydrolase [Microbaculum sp. FT89]|uniref:N-formylglutamate amidohydrolase n=1 Tax=Microbaculum sp. FT89 TaxID=3447298 RepID=UPI003F52C409